MKKNLRVLFFVALIQSMSFSKAQQVTQLTADEFEKAIISQDTAQLLDVRTIQEYNSGHIKNALQADWHDQKEFERRIAFLEKHKPVYVYCMAGGRSLAAAGKLKELGYEYIYELKGGTNAWRAANKMLEGNRPVRQMSLSNLHASITGAKTVLLDFGAQWCPPCKKMEPVLKKLEVDNAGKFVIIKIDGGTDENIMKHYQVTELPVFIIFKNGKQVWRKEGIATEKELSEQLQ